MLKKLTIVTTLLLTCGQVFALSYSPSLEAYARQGSPCDQCSLAQCYENGNGVAKDEKQALKWYRKSAEGGYSVAACYLARVYEYGFLGVKRDLREALKYYRLAVKLGEFQEQKNVDRLEDCLGD